MKEVMNKGKKKLVAVAMVGILGLSAAGSTYAYKDAWTPKINQGLSVLAGYVFKGDIEKAVSDHGDAKEVELKSWANSLINSLTNDLKAFKEQEINRGKAGVDAKVQSEKEALQKAANDALAAEKAKQAEKTNAEVQAESADIDTAVEGFLNQIPN